MRQQKILLVDLSTGQISTELVPRDVESMFIGSRSVNAYYVYKMIKPGTDPLGPENVLMFGTGALTGTTAPCSGRTSVTCKSPVTGFYTKASGGGHWGAELKFAGYDYVLCTGRADHPVYLWVDNDKVELKDARAHWGQEIIETTYSIREELGNDDVQIASIGPAGENGVMAACVNFSVHHAAARGGVGTVMGAKNLKAIAVRGTGSISVDNPQAFYEASQRIRRELAADNGTVTLAVWGTAGSLPATNELYALNVRNFQNNFIEYADKVSGQYMKDAGYLTGRVACNGCSTACHRYVTSHSEKYGDVIGSGPEFESLVSLGSGPDVSDMQSIFVANEICNATGMDTISAGAYVQFAMECYEKGYITKEDTDGIDLTWGNGIAMNQVLRKIAKKEGRIGKLLAKGTKRAAEELGGEAWKCAVQAKGLEQSCCETRSAKSYALAFAVNPRGPDHLMTETFAEFGASPEAIDVIEQITGDRKYATPHSTEKRAEIVRWHEDVFALTEALGICVFTSTAAFAVNPKNMVEMYNAATGANLTPEDGMRVGERTVNVERCFNVREGARRADDKLPWRLMNEPVKTGPRKGAINSKEEMDMMLDQYYPLHGWDVETAIPKPETLERLGLGQLCSDCVAQAKESVEKEGQNIAGE
jgi:aldehyde:ferredoxin oxidoreductase